MSGSGDVIVIGGGMAGLAAAVELSRLGFSVSIIEARRRVGGRILTENDSLHHEPVELGAEFIHGRPREIWQPLRKQKVRTIEVEGEQWCVRNNELCPCDFFSRVDKILEKMNDRQSDESFREFLERQLPEGKISSEKQETKEKALRYVTGFNAADPDLVGVHWLVKGSRAEEELDGDRSFRAVNGYGQLVEIFRQSLVDHTVAVHTGTVVERIQWRAGHVRITARSDAGSTTLSAARVLVTLPLGVLQASVGDKGGVEFSPKLPADKREALKRLEMGKVIRVSLVFRERFWEQIRAGGRGSKTLTNMSFLFSEDEWFPTWWTAMPKKFPMITGWAPFRSAEMLSHKDRTFVIEQSLKTLSRLLKISARELSDLLHEFYLHDWQADPFSRGAYSYGKVGAGEAQEALARPLSDTLFFAGEATDTRGHNGTVHGAIASGYRAAAEIRRSSESACLTPRRYSEHLIVAQGQE